MHGKTYKFEGMGCTYWYAGLAALPALSQAFYEVVKVLCSFLNLYC